MECSDVVLQKYKQAQTWGSDMDVTACTVLIFRLNPKSSQ